MNATLHTAPEHQRPVLHKLIDELPDDELGLVERLLARLEMERLWKDVRAAFTQDWEAGRYERLDEIIREVRNDLKRAA